MDTTAIFFVMIILTLAISIKIFWKQQKWVIGIIVLLIGLGTTTLPNITQNEKTQVTGTIGTTTIDLNVTNAPTTNTTDNKIAYSIGSIALIISGLIIAITDISWRIMKQE